MHLKKRILGPISAAVLLTVPVVAVAALQPWSGGSSADRSAALSLVEGAQPLAAVANTKVVDLSDWKYTGKSDKSAKSDKSRKSPKSIKSDKSKKSKKSAKSDRSKKPKNPGKSKNAGKSGKSKK